MEATAILMTDTVLMHLPVHAGPVESSVTNAVIS
jgi:hypothetical protein